MRTMIPVFEAPGLTVPILSVACQSNFCPTWDDVRRAPVVDCVWNVMAHAQKPYFFFCRNGRVHLNRRGRQFSWLLAAEVYASAFVMLDTPRSEVVWEYWLPTPFASFPFTSPPMRHRVPSGFKRTLPWLFRKMALRHIITVVWGSVAGCFLENGWMAPVGPRARTRFR